MKRHDKLAETIPYGTLGILALESSRDMGKRVNDYIVDWRNDRAQNHATAASFAGYNRDSFIIDSACPRFGSGEAKGIIRESVRGQDLYILVDVCNYNLTYTVCGQTNHMSPDDHYQDLKRIIATATGKAHRINVIMPFLYESRMRKLVRDFLVKQNFEVLEAGDGEEALDVFYKNKDIALIILDVMMPKMNGWDVCREIRESSKTPIIMLTAKSEESDELLGFELGVDEYISKPFSPKILVARVEAILRRTGNYTEDDVLEVGGIVMDKAAHMVTIDGKNIDLSYKEFELLAYFMENKGIALSREKILNHVWNYDYFGDARTIDTHVKKLRSKMGEKGDYIKTIWGMGYKLDIDASQ